MAAVKPNKILNFHQAANTPKGLVFMLNLANKN